MDSDLNDPVSSPFSTHSLDAGHVATAGPAHSLESASSARSSWTTHQGQSLDIHNSQPRPVAASTGSSRVSTNTTARSTGAEKSSTVTKKKSQALCRFYGTRKGCRAGDQCPFLHADLPRTHGAADARTEVSSVPPLRDTLDSGEPGPSAQTGDLGIPAQTTSRNGPRSREVSTKPLPQPGNAREFEINQVVRRFSPSTKESDPGTILTFKLRPSDPDFPFELEGLQCSLTVPKDYPKDGRPSIRVSNAEMARGYQINVERGFDGLTTAGPKRTLLSLLNELDKNLEKFLTSEKAQTIKIVANVDKQQTKPDPVQSAAPVAAIPQLVVQRKPPPPSYTAQQKQDAQIKRQADVRQLEARMSRVPLFAKSPDGLTFNIPVQIAKSAKLPPALQAVKEVTLSVPSMYNFEPCTIKVRGVSGLESQNVELAFEKHARQNSHLTLMAHVNHLTQNIAAMAVDTVTEPIASTTASLPESAAASTQEDNSVVQKDTATAESVDLVLDTEHPHIKIIPRPPEWDRVQGTPEDEDDSTDYDTDEIESHSDGEYDEDEDEEAGGATIPGSSLPASTAEKGILLSFPDLELYGVELLQISSLSLTLKCDRCKEATDMKNIKPSSSTSSQQHTTDCPKCTTQLAVTYRPEPLHANSMKAGYLDLDACTVQDLLPSAFLPTCAECSTTLNTNPGLISVRGETTMSICRTCHNKMTFRLPSTKFLRVSANAAALLNRPLPPKRKKENLGITTGTELPQRGKCKHYSKSYRWFRFSCCNKVYACDRCHDEKEKDSHTVEHANRMICGWCSREQNYRPEDCGICGRDLIGKKGGGFWEGGKGTRDRTRMRRKDTRKFKRLGGSKVGS